MFHPAGEERIRTIELRHVKAFYPLQVEEEKEGAK